MPFYGCELHHTHDYGHGGRTDIDELTVACQPANLLVENTGWTTQRRGNGRAGMGSTSRNSTPANPEPTLVPPPPHLTSESADGDGHPG